MLTRIFKSGNSLAVRIPKELAFVEAAQDVEIERVGNALMVRPVEQPSLAGIGQIFAMFSEDFMAEGREFHEEQSRDWAGLDQDAATGKV
jgi:antitoxin VapB